MIFITETQFLLTGRRFEFANSSFLIIFDFCVHAISKHVLHHIFTKHLLRMLDYLVKFLFVFLSLLMAPVIAQRVMCNAPIGSRTVFVERSPAVGNRPGVNPSLATAGVPNSGTVIAIERWYVYFLQFSVPSLSGSRVDSPGYQQSINLWIFSNFHGLYVNYI